MDASKAARIIYNMQNEYDIELGWLLHKMFGCMFERCTRYSILYVKDLDAYVKEHNLPKTSQQYVDEVCHKYNYEHLTLAHPENGELIYQIRIPTSEMHGFLIG